MFASSLSTTQTASLPCCYKSDILIL